MEERASFQLQLNVREAKPRKRGLTEIRGLRFVECGDRIRDGIARRHGGKAAPDRLIRGPRRRWVERKTATVFRRNTWWAWEIFRRRPNDRTRPPALCSVERS
jgi:hypothetical protein